MVLSGWVFNCCLTDVVVKYLFNSSTRSLNLPASIVNDNRVKNVFWQLWPFARGLLVHH